MDVGEDVVFMLCSVKTIAAFVVAEEAGFNKVVITGENDITVTLATVVKDCPMLIFFPSEVAVRFTGGGVGNWGRYTVVFSVIDSNELGVNVVSPSGFTCASFVGNVLVAISDISIILVLTGNSVVLSVSAVPVKKKGEIGLLSDSVLVVTACLAVTV